MKKLLFIPFVLLCLIGCESDGQLMKDPLDYTSVVVKIENADLEEIIVFDASGSVVGKGLHTGTYDVPKGGAIEIAWYTSLWGKREKIAVGVASQLTILINGTSIDFL